MRVLLGALPVTQAALAWLYRGLIADDQEQLPPSHSPHGCCQRAEESTNRSVSTTVSGNAYAAPGGLPAIEARHVAPTDAHEPLQLARYSVPTSKWVRIIKSQVRIIMLPDRCLFRKMQPTTRGSGRATNSE